MRNLVKHFCCCFFLECVRARQLLVSRNALDVPDCAENGNYLPAACRRGICYCIDEDGLQNSNEVPFAERDSLACCRNGACEGIGLSR